MGKQAAGKITGLLQIFSLTCDAEFMAPCAMGITSKGFPRDNHSLGVPKKQVLKATEKLRGHKLPDFPNK